MQNAINTITLPPVIAKNPTQCAAWRELLDASSPPDYEVCLNQTSARKMFDTPQKWVRFINRLKDNGLITNYYTQYKGGRTGILQYGQIPIRELATHITLPASAYNAKLSDTIPLRYWEWLDRKDHPELWQDVQTLYQQGAWPKAICATIYQQRPRSRSNSALAASFWQENRALLLYALLTRECPISELARRYMGLQDETMLYRYVAQQWGLQYRCCEPAQMHRQHISGVGFVEGRVTWDKAHKSYKLVSARNTAHMLQWSPNRGFYPVDKLQGDVRLEHIAALEPHVQRDQLIRDITAYCYDAGLPLPQYDSKGVLRIDQRAATAIYNFKPETLKAVTNRCGCQFFDDATLKCGLEPKRKTVRCEDYYPLEVSA